MRAQLAVGYEGQDTNRQWQNRDSGECSTLLLQPLLPPAQGRQAPVVAIPEVSAGLTTSRAETPRRQQRSV